MTNALVNNIAFKALNLIVFIPIWIALFLLFRPDYSSVTLTTILLAVPGILIGFCLNFLLGAMITCMAFWTTRVYSVSQFFYLLIVLLSGQFVPLQLLPPVVQQIAQYLPFQMFRFVPVEIIRNRLSASEIVFDYAISLVWLVIFYLLFRWVWREGVKRFSAVGA